MGYGIGGNGMSKVSIDPKSLFQGKDDIRKYLSVGMSDFIMTETLISLELDHDTVEEILSLASIYVNLDELPEYMYVEEA